MEQYNLKKIISFSLWGNKPFYTQGAIENAKLQKEIYPGWVCRFYYDETVPSHILNELLDLGCELIGQPISDGNYGMFWRFKPLDDTNIERFIVRDTDCRLNIREADAVREWEESEKLFHIMRDNVQHNMVPICGGMWGATGSFKPNYENLLSNWLDRNGHRVFMHPRGKYFYIDQSFLQETIWPMIANKHIAHESVKSSWSGDKRTFKIENDNKMFVGQGIDL